MAMPAPHTTFPTAEGIGIFVGVVAWDLLAEGHPHIIKALLIAVPCSLVWFALRCWKKSASRSVTECHANTEQAQQTPGGDAHRM